LEVYRNVLSKEEIENLLIELTRKFPEIQTQNCYIEELGQEFEYLKMLPQLYFPQLTGKSICCILISSVTSKETYAGERWHVDGRDNETTALLYLQGDPSRGGKFKTEDGVYEFESGTFFILPANIRHFVTAYNNDISRICLKWLFINN
jgi:hypothetical protein